MNKDDAMLWAGRVMGVFAGGLTSIACCTTTETTMVLEPSQVWVQGYQQGFMTPRNDVGVGAVILKLDDDNIRVVCNVALKEGETRDGGLLHLEQTSRETLEAAAAAHVRKIVEVELGTRVLRSMKTSSMMRNISLHNAGIVAKRAESDPDCIESATRLKNDQSKTPFWLVTDVAEVTFAHDAIADSSEEANVAVAQLAAKLGSGTVGIRSGTTNIVHIGVVRQFLNYNTLPLRF